MIGDISEQKGSEKELTTLLGEEIEVGGQTIILPKVYMTAQPFILAIS
ncbi:hypothetical protein CV093_13600 [Oceanobacillus sp. 143]|nr:hypothetical protein CV093_13600 [Oceanobacillus sp. 143]